MTPKEKELIAVAASVAAGCEPCTRHHVEAAKRAGGEAGDLRRMIELALSVRERATQRMAAVAARELGAPADFPACTEATSPTRLEALASAAAALAANCGSGVPGFLAAAARQGATERDGEVALGIARQIKKVAGERADEATRGHEGRAGQACCAAATASDPRACG